MTVTSVILVLLALAAGGYVAARAKAIASGQGDARRLHSLPGYYGTNAALFILIPSLLLLGLWLVFQPILIDSKVKTMIPANSYDGSGELSLVMSDVRRVADGLDLAADQGVITDRSDPADLDDLRDKLGQVGVALGADIKPSTLKAAETYRALSARAKLIRNIAVLGLGLGGLALAMTLTNKDFRARNTVEKAVLWLLVGAASIAILTTLGIVLSLIFNTIEFFQLYRAADFFFGTKWAPSFSGRGGASDLGILPLFWGTLYISVIALLVAVPVGLFAAIYLAEYASPMVRGIAKPMLEVLAGIPTIVYGLFALLTVGPLLVSVFGDGGVLGVAWMDGGTAVMTAGLVMGIMLIPFVSSLSDDIINAVPQSMRDGSLGLGATRSETIRQVVLPAALPGIVGAVLLAASRAIGETMIVVLGAGAAARLSMNPFEAMTTVTAKIVSQLTGDADFASPEALVAFSLGMTLFVITLGLNIFALWIVRKYREQYE